MCDSEALRNIEEIPLPYRNVFNEYPCFNAVQSKVFDDILYTDQSVVISSPTGSGKTAIFELAIVRLLLQCENLGIFPSFKIVYICPIKSLCQERLTDWHRKFSALGLNCASFTGDSDNVDFQQLTNHNVIISTPEKWDSLTRRWRDNQQIVKVVKLFLIDEVHLLNEENRGSTLEVIVSRMKTVEKTVDGDVYNQKIRFVALSATVPNVEDIAEWLGKPPNVKYYRFSEEMRPVKLKKIVLGYNKNPKTTSPFKFDLSLNYKLQSLMMQYSEGKPTLIFCSTRKSVEMTANHIVQTLRIQLTHEQIEKLTAVADLIPDSKTKTTLKHGIGIHHAGMIPDTRHAIENIFRRGDLPVLVTTSTLAMGVNLPAHLVIVKSTKCYDNGGFRDYTETAIHQMIGRAGRPQFDTSATALILTTNEDKPKFEKMVGCGQPIESNLHRHLIEHLNAEVVLRTITDLEVAMQWLASTFLYVRARKNPRPYGLNTGLSKDQIDKKLLEICQIDLNKLVKAGMLTMDQDIIITPTTTGQIMAKFYIAFETMKLFTQISGTEILIQILELVARCQEFSEIRLRVNDKKPLNFLNKNANKDTIRFPLNGKIKTWNMKVNCIIQAVLGNLEISDQSILSDTFTIMRNGERVVKCLIEYLETRKENCYTALLNTLTLCKCFHAKLWENSPYVSKQLSGIGSVMSHQLVNAGKTTFRKILESNPRDIEMIIKRKNPMGNSLIEEVRHIPIYEMTLERDGNQLRLRIQLVNAEDLREKITVKGNSSMTLLVGNDLNEILVYEKYRHSYMIEKGTILKWVEINRGYSEVNAHFISNDWVGIDCNSTVFLQSIVNADKEAGTEQAAGKNEEKKNPTYIQMFIDMYMKTQKKPAQEKSKPDKKTKPNKGMGGKGGDVVASSESGKKKKRKMATSGAGNKGRRNDVVDRVQIGEENKEESIRSRVQIEEEENKEEEDYQLGVGADIDELGRYKGNDVESSGRNEENELPKDGVCDTSGASLFSNELSTSAFVDHVDRMNEKIKEDMRRMGADAVEERRQDDDCLTMEKELNAAKPPIDLDDKLSKNPSIFAMSQKYLTDEYVVSGGGTKARPRNKQRRRNEDFPLALRFDGLKEDAKKRQKVAEFKFPTKRKLYHRDAENLPDSTQDKKFYAITELLEPADKNRRRPVESEPPFDDVSAKSKDAENAQKVTWRSPLVFSPAAKFSPKLTFQKGFFSRDEGENENTNETFETISSKGMDLVVQRTPRPSKNVVTPKRYQPTKFPLRDRDYEGESGASEENKTQEIPNEDGLDICSTSFLEKFGLPKQNRSTPGRDGSPAANYYSRLISHPIHSQKEGNKAKEANEKINKGRVEKSPGHAAEAENKENEPRRGFPYDVSRRESNFRDLILAQNSPLSYGNRTLDYSITSELSADPRGRNANPHFFPPRPESFPDFPYGLRPSFARNPLPYAIRPSSLNETITSNSYRDGSSHAYHPQRCQMPRQVCGNPCCQIERIPRPSYRNNYNERTNATRTLPDELFVDDFGQRSRYFPQYNFPHCDYDVNNGPRYDVAYQYAPITDPFIDRSFDRRGPAERFSDQVLPRSVNASFFKPELRREAADRQSQISRTAPDDGRGNCDVKSFEEMVNRSLSFDDKPKLSQERVNLMPRRDFADVYGAPREVGVEGGCQKWDFGRGNFSRGQRFFNREEPVAWQNYYPEDYHGFPASNDKEYVMNKFLYSLSQD